jgi:hypothetical protein
MTENRLFSVKASLKQAFYYIKADYKGAKTDLAVARKSTLPAK